MESFGRKGDVRTPKHLNPDNINFSMFTSEDVRKLCVVKIHTHITFDALGHPLSGGLHDKCLGPLDDKSSDPCGTCLKNAYSCPGHYGYIELPLPTVNPLFHKIIATILKKSCLLCYHILFPSHVRHSLKLQMKLLDSGYVSEAIEVEDRILELVSQHKHYDNIPEEDMIYIKKYEELVQAPDKNAASMNKNTETIRNQFITNVFTRVESKKRCPHCKAPLIGVSSLKNKLMIAVQHLLSSDNEKGSQIKAMKTKPVTPEESRTIFRKLWENEAELLSQLVPVLRGVNTKYPTDVFYFDIIPVVPSNVRPISKLAGSITEHHQTRVYKAILQDCLVLRAAIKVHQTNDIESLTSEAKTVYMLARGSSALEKMHNCWELLQTDVNSLLDQESKLGGEQGLKQLIEKKAGIIRMHMMGKRVNFAARSVITPDPNLNIDEIGIPEVFAKHLTYPVPVTLWNVEELRKLIQNGPNVHPGAVAVEINNKVTRINPNLKTQQESIFKQLLTPDDPNKGFKGVKLVHRHLCNGDILLLNRQPTLHKPSIMAHTARILKGEKTLRLHYANCKAYNADFDGDEMNAHFPQNELARSEGYTIANVSNQYLVPKDGTPLSGLIQDHMISGVRMSVRGKFFEKHDYQQLIYQALSFKTSRIKLLKPAIMKPAALWSGKQILSTVILNIIPKHRTPINLTAGSKIPAKAWQNAEVRPWKAGGTELKENSMTEAEVVIRGGELLVGILDKTHYGATPYGLVHCMYELYGGSYAIKLLSSLAKLFTCFLQREGFTLGVHDILVLTEADKERTEIIKRSRAIGNAVMSKALNIAESDDCHHVLQHTEEQYAANPKLRTIIDRQYKSSIDSYTNEINKVCLPAGLVCKFPSNNLQLMVQSGAKGSTVNTMQISCLLGQIELEGKRPPIMISGRSLPSFPPFEFAPRAGGFIDGRFMTGIQPQEFFFHCMAGREGLIDTAVKTSRSGYLQRCLIKHLEGLSVGYDMTVRDSDKSVIQFAYGEDGMDISKAQFLNKTQMPFLVDNCKAIIDEAVIESLQNVDDYDKFLKYSKGLKKWKKRHEGEEVVEGTRTPFSYFSEQVFDKVKVEKPFKVNGKTGRGRKAAFICDLWQQAGDDIKAPFVNKRDPQPDPSVARYQADAFFGSINERLIGLVDDFASESNKKKKIIDKLMKMKSMQSLCAPGESVGLLAAQSIGEPSTQMTLNTFHFAGRGEMNVTLGIPRLREILMMASKNIKTPSMEVPFLKVPNLEHKAEKLRKILTRTVVADVLEKIVVTQELDMVPVRQHKVVLRFQFMPHKLYKDDYHVKPEKIIKYMSDKFFKLMFMTIRKYAKVNSSMLSMEENKLKNAASKADDDEDAGPTETPGGGGADDLSSDEDIPEDDEDAKLASKYNKVHDDQEPEEVDAENGNESNDDEDNDEKKDKPIEDEDEADSSSTKMSEDQVSSIRSYVVDRHALAHNYTFDSKKFRWCELTFGLPLNFKKIDLTAILKEVAGKAVLWETPGIKRAITYMNNDVLTLRTDGINLVEMFKYNTLLDLNKLYSNDIHKVAETYGIEAGMRVIVKEVRDVFKVYGITVDPRHLSLIADYMTYGGSFEPLSRKGMESSASPLQQMSFEASLAFLKSAAIRGKNDKLTNPSSCLMIGKPCNTGTGSFTLLQKMSTELLAKT